MSSRNWVAGNRGWVMTIFLEAAPHKVGAVSPVRVTRGSRKNTPSWKRIVVVVVVVVVVECYCILKNNYCWMYGWAGSRLA